MKKTFFAVGLLVMTANGVIAQGMNRAAEDDFDTTTSFGYQKLDKKKPQFWRRPEESTPAAQLAYAKDQEEAGHKKRAERQYNVLVHRWHQSEQAPIAQLAYARLLFERGRYERAFREFQYMVQFFAGEFDYDQVLDYQLRIANQILGKRRGTFGFFPGFQSPERAIPLLEAIVLNAPNWEKAPSIRLTIAMVYEDAKEYNEAIRAYESVVQSHPNTPEAQTAAYRQAKCLADLSDKSPRDERQCRDALSALASFITAYPQSERREEAESRLQDLKSRLEMMYFQRAEYYDKIEKRPDSALVSYREFLKRFPASDKAPAILQRIETLEQHQKRTP